MRGSEDFDRGGDTIKKEADRSPDVTGRNSMSWAMSLFAQRIDRKKRILGKETRSLRQCLVLEEKRYRERNNGTPVIGAKERPLMHHLSDPNSGQGIWNGSDKKYAPTDEVI